MYNENVPAGPSIKGSLAREGLNVIAPGVGDVMGVGLDKLTKSGWMGRVKNSKVVKDIQDRDKR
jgi:hypothetical protein